MAHGDSRQMPDIGCYGDYASSNYGFHTLVVDFGVVTVWFSYTTPVAFQVQGGCKVVHQNDWGKTTGRHLNFIDGGNKRNRVTSEEFHEQWNRQVAPFFDEDAAMAAAQEDLPPAEPSNGQLPVVTRKLLPLPKLKIGRK